MLKRVDVYIAGMYVVISHGTDYVGLKWSEAEALYFAGKRLIKDAVNYDASGEWSESLASEQISGLEFRRTGLIVHLLKHGKLWISAPYQYMRQILKAVYCKAKELEQEDPIVAWNQITDTSTLYVSGVPIGLTLDSRKIKEALKLIPSGSLPKGVVSTPVLVGGHQ